MVFMNVCLLVGRWFSFFVYAYIYVNDGIKYRNNMFVLSAFKELTTVSSLNNHFQLQETGDIQSGSGEDSSVKWHVLSDILNGVKYVKP